MVGVGLGAVAIIVELVAFAEIKQVKSAFNGVRVSVEAFHDSPVLGMREILDFRGGQCAGLHLLKHLLQCGASIVGWSVVIAQYQDRPHVIVGVYGHYVRIISTVSGRENGGVECPCRRISVGAVAGAVHADVYIGSAIGRCCGYRTAESGVGNDFLKSVESVFRDVVWGDNVDRRWRGDVFAGEFNMLRNRVNCVGSGRHIGGCNQR